MKKLWILGATLALVGCESKIDPNYPGHKASIEICKKIGGQRLSLSAEHAIAIPHFYCWDNDGNIIDKWQVNQYNNYGSAIDISN